MQTTYNYSVANNFNGYIDLGKFVEQLLQCGISDLVNYYQSANMYGDSVSITFSQAITQSDLDNQIAIAAAYTTIVKANTDFADSANINLNQINIELPYILSKYSKVENSGNNYTFYFTSALTSNENTAFNNYVSTYQYDAGYDQHYYFDTTAFVATSSSSTWENKLLIPLPKISMSNIYKFYFVTQLTSGTYYSIQVVDMATGLVLCQALNNTNTGFTTVLSSVVANQSVSNSVGSIQMQTDGSCTIQSFGCAYVPYTK